MDMSTISNEKHDEQLAKVAYSLGFILGDGYLQSYSIVKNGKRYPAQCIRVGKPDLDALERIRAEIKACFDAEYAIIPKKIPSGLAFHQICLWRRDIFEFFAINTAHKAKIPEFYFSANDDIKRDLIAGLMDSDGYISEKKADGRWKMWSLGFGMTNRDIVSGAASIMKSLGVKIGKMSEYQKGNYALMYGIRPNIRSFIEAGCYFHAQRKAGKLADCMSHLLGSETTNAAPVTPGEGIVQHTAKAL